MTSPPPTTPTPYPPPEIWRQIFRFATRSETSYDVDYLPFQPIQELLETSASHEQECLRLETCLSLMLVSQHFRAVAVEFMYEDVRIFDARGLESLMAGLYRSAKEDGANGYGSYVRRLELPRRRTKFQPDTHNLPFPTHPIPCDPDAPRLDDILWLCPRLEILIRPCLRLDAENITFWSTLVGTPVVGCLSRLMRLEWHESELDSRFYGTNNAHRLREIVSQAPNLRYLFLSSDRQNSLADLSLPPSLRTIRINRSHFQSSSPKRFMVKSRHALYVPNFRNLVLHTTLPSALLDFVATTGHQLRVLELAFAPQMTFSSNQMQRLLSRCPLLEELAYYIGAPEISPLVEFQSPSVKRVRLKINPDEWNPCKPVLRGQMEVLEGPSFPKLEEIILHDPTRWFMRRDLGKDLLRRMLRRGCTVRYEDGSEPPIALST
ncbi:t-SNARE coiled-coil-like proteiny domain-containing protein [Mycena venus]|uniref:t-SNARE coiled-coil-like proteiny domain-containing protein n=1 Tax=Mycena venus TaxID=2733690 RepID=A0A8H6YA66_9AGAR|nr:t-SNARE coiled-coil-like proteiny domain-containing protein [Mycena venus]